VNHNDTKSIFRELTSEVEQALASFISGTSKKFIQHKLQIQSHVSAVPSLAILDSLISILASESSFQWDQVLYAYRIDGEEGCSCVEMGMKILSLLRRSADCNHILVMCTAKGLGMYPRTIMSSESGNGKESVIPESLIPHVLQGVSDILDIVRKSTGYNRQRNALFNFDKLISKHRSQCQSLTSKTLEHSQKLFGKDKKEGMHTVSFDNLNLEKIATGGLNNRTSKRTSKYSKNHFKYTGDDEDENEEELFTTKLLTDVNVEQMCENEASLESFSPDHVRTLKALREPSPIVQKVIVMIALLKDIQDLIPANFKPDVDKNTGQISSKSISLKSFKMTWHCLKKLVLTPTLRTELLLLHKNIVPDINQKLAEAIVSELSIGINIVEI